MYPTNMAKPKQIRTALSIYRVMAFIAGIALFILIAEMIMKYALKQENFFTESWSYIHGFLFMGYAASVANLGVKVAWKLERIVKNILVGFVPVLPFIAEHRNTAEINAMLSRAYFAGGPDTAAAAAQGAAAGAGSPSATPDADTRGASPRPEDGTEAR